MNSNNELATENDIDGEISSTRSFIINPDCPIELQVKATTPRRIFRNVFLIGFSNFLLYSGVFSLSNLQSTMNAEEGLGPYSQAVFCLFSMISCFFPQLLIEKFGSKKTYLMAFLASIPNIAANFYPRWDVMMTTSVLSGMFTGPLNAGLSFYIDEMATRYVALKDQSTEYGKTLFFGISTMFIQSTQIFGSSISYLVLNRDKHQNDFSFQNNCGVHFNPDAANGTDDNSTPSERSRIMLTGIYLLLSVFAFFLVLAVDPLKNDVKNIQSCDTVSKSFFAFFNLLRNPHQLLLIPLSIFCGMEDAFFANSLTEAYIACSWGIQYVGVVAIGYGVCGAIISLLVGPMVKCVSQMPIIILNFFVSGILYTLLFFWQPSPDAIWAYFVFAGVWGMTDAIWWSQTIALHGLMFPNDREAAFSNFYFWSFLGYFVSFLTANVSTVAVKIDILLVSLITGITFYVIGRIRIKCFSRRGYVAISNSE